MSMRPSSLMMTPTRRRCCAPSTRFKIVVFPAPRNPVSRTSGGLEAASSAGTARDYISAKARTAPPSVLVDLAIAARGPSRRQGLPLGEGRWHAGAHGGGDLRGRTVEVDGAVL